MELARPDGARIHYEVRGDGPVVVLSSGFVATPDVYAALGDDLARDHAFVTWDLRGCGQSSDTAPFDLANDGADLAALIDELGGQAKVFGLGHGVNIGAYCAAQAPGRVSSMVAHGITTSLIADLPSAGGIAASPSVTEMLIEQLRRDPRAAVRSILGMLNPQLDEEALRARVEDTIAYAGIDPSLERLGPWLESSPLEELRALGDRLCVLSHDGDRFQAGTFEGVQQLLPEAQRRHLLDGPLSRPDLTAELIREMT